MKLIVASLAVAAGLVTLSALAQQGQETPASVPREAIQLTPPDLKWSDAPASMPRGAKVAVLEGHPGSEGLFTIRIRVPAQTKVPLHTHPGEERVTVIEGSVYVGFGESFQMSKAKYFPVGSYYVNPPDVPHFLLFTEPAVLQVTGTGPWTIDYVERSRATEGR